MPAVVDGQHPVPGAGQIVVHGPPVEVGGGHPAVEEHHRRPIAAAVAEEELAALWHGDRARWRESGRRLGGPEAGTAATHVGHPTGARDSYYHLRWPS